MSGPGTSIGMSQWLFDESRKMSSSAGEYQSAGAGVLGSSGSKAPGMSSQRKSWNVRTSLVRIGYFEYTTIPNWPGKNPNPNASFGPPMIPSLEKSIPLGM